MLIAVIGAEKIRYPIVGNVSGMMFIVFSILFYKKDNGLLTFGLGLMACVAVLMIVSGTEEYEILDKVSNYTMPIFLMHTLFAAPVRIALVRIGIIDCITQLTVGFTISFVGPILAFELMKKLKLTWMIFPKLIKDDKYESFDGK